MLGADVIILETAGFFLSRIERLFHAAAQIKIARARALHLMPPRQFTFQVGPQLVPRHADSRQQIRNETVSLPNQRQHQMFAVNFLMRITVGDPLRLLQCFLRLDRQFLHLHTHQFQFTWPDVKAFGLTFGNPLNTITKLPMRTRHRPRYVPVLSGIVAALALFCIAQLRSEAAPTNFWSGGGADNNWTTAANWSGSVAPSPGNNLNFPWISALLGNSATPFNNFADGTAFGQINIGINNLANAKSYTFSGNRLVVTNGISVSGGLGFATFNLNITLGADQAFTASRVLTFNGFLDLTNHQLIVNNSSSVTFNGIVTNGGFSASGILKTNTGTMLISSNAQISNVPVGVEYGTLIFDGTTASSLFSTGAVATISGTGMAYQLSAENGGVISPGDGAVGILSCSYLNGAPDILGLGGELDILVQSAA